MNIRYIALLLLTSSAVEARSMFQVIKDARKSVKEALNKASSKSLNDLLGRKTPKPILITPELLRSFGSPTAYEHLEKANALYGKLFWAEQYELVSALDLIAKSNAPESRTMLKTMLKKAMIDHTQTTNPSTLDFVRELLTEEALLAQVLNELMAAVSGLQNDASMKAVEFDVKNLHERRNKDVATLCTLQGLVAEFLAI
ncbi:hypothetical protein FJ365_02255 [Candidatus Dependentiae bacterium]|nr:hypothetical protein [Candidatus Dependentiae bacterium]